MSRSDQSRFPLPSASPQVPSRRVLFLDDDPGRAEIFLAEVPHAVWVSTVADCLLRLEEVWDEVHLDHDLGGETFVDCGREDCGMEVVRWLCLKPHPHLASTRFYVHSHNAGAADLMVMQLRVNGFRVEARPFGHFVSAGPADVSRAEPPRASERGLSAWLRELGRYVFGPVR